MREPAAGVLGGVGPLATVYLMQRVIELTQAASDQEHVNMVVLNHAAIPDRTAFLLGRSTADPLPVLLEDARALSDAGVAFIVMPCNTAHHYYDALAESVDVPFVNLIGETLRRARGQVDGLRKVGVLATDGTLAVGVYAKAAAAMGLDAVAPDREAQADVMDMIYSGVKAGRPVARARLDAAIDHLRSQGAQAIVLGCTELSILARDFDLDAPDVVDSLDTLARRTVELSGKTVKY